MGFVQDNSVALAWCFADERTPSVMALLDRTAREGAVAPSLWHLEAINALFVSQRKRRITREQRKRLMRDLWTLPIEIDHGLWIEGRCPANKLFGTQSKPSAGATI